jgi:hypothetical protein
MAPRGCPPAPLGVPGAVGAGGGVPVAWVRALPPVKSPLLDSAQTVVLGRIKEFQLALTAFELSSTRIQFRELSSARPFPPAQVTSLALTL